jgi:hypothetical protein
MTQLKGISYKKYYRLPGACIAHLGIITTSVNKTFKPNVVMIVGIYWLVWSTKGIL